MLQHILLCHEVLKKNEVIKEFLIELAISATIGNPINGHFLDKTQRKKLEEIIEPFRITITSELKNI